MSEPIAWAVQKANSWEPPLLFTDRERAQKAAVCMDVEAVPLFRHPELTSAEREAIEIAMHRCDTPEFKTLRDLLGRTK